MTEWNTLTSQDGLQDLQDRLGRGSVEGKPTIAVQLTEGGNVSEHLLEHRDLTWSPWQQDNRKDKRKVYCHAALTTAAWLIMNLQIYQTVSLPPFLCLVQSNSSLSFCLFISLSVFIHPPRSVALPAPRCLAVLIYSCWACDSGSLAGETTDRKQTQTQCPAVMVKVFPARRPAHLARWQPGLSDFHPWLLLNWKRKHRVGQLGLIQSGFWGGMRDGAGRPLPGWRFQEGILTSVLNSELDEVILIIVIGFKTANHSDWRRDITLLPQNIRQSISWATTRYAALWYTYNTC